MKSNSMRGMSLTGAEIDPAASAPLGQKNQNDSIHGLHPWLQPVAPVGRMERAAMNTPDISTAKNPDVRSALAALQRASELARTEAIQTDTSIVIVNSGKIVHVTAEELRQERASKAS